MVQLTSAEQCGMISFALLSRLFGRLGQVSAMGRPLRGARDPNLPDDSQPTPSTVSRPATPPSASGPVPALPPRRRPRWLAFLTILGPGIIAAAAGNDAGGIATYSQMGAQYGISLLWTVLVVTVGLIVVQEMCARMGAVTGKGLAALIRENFGVKVTFFAMICLTVANLALTVSEFAGIAAVGEMFLGPHARFVVVPIAMVIVWLLVARGTYKNVERIFIVASLIFLTYIVTAVKIGVPWLGVLSHTLLPDFAHTNWNAGLVISIVTLIGTTISPYMQFYQQAAVRDKGTKMKDYAFVKWGCHCRLRSVRCRRRVYYHRLCRNSVQSSCQSNQYGFAGGSGAGTDCR